MRAVCTSHADSRYFLAAKLRLKDSKLQPGRFEWPPMESNHGVSLNDFSVFARNPFVQNGGQRDRHHLGRNAPAQKGGDASIVGRKTVEDENVPPRRVDNPVVRNIAASPAIIDDKDPAPRRCFPNMIGG